MTDAIIIMCVHCFTVAPTVKNAQRCHTHCHMDLTKARHRQVVRWYVRDVLVLCMNYEGAFRPVSRFLRTSATGRKDLPCAEITGHAFLGVVSEDQKERTKTPHSLDIDVITRPLRTPANHHTLNRFLYSMSRIGRTTSRCTARRRARVRSWTFRDQNT